MVVVVAVRLRLRRKDMEVGKRRKREVRVRDLATHERLLATYHPMNLRYQTFCMERKRLRPWHRLRAKEQRK